MKLTALDIVEVLGFSIEEWDYEKQHTEGAGWDVLFQGRVVYTLENWYENEYKVAEEVVEKIAMLLVNKGFEEK